jgi:hypothetical protein
MIDPPASPGGGSSLFREPLLVVRQEPEIVDSTPMYAILDQHGARVGSLADVGQRDLRTALRPDQLAGQAAPAGDKPAGGFMAAMKTLSSIAREQPYRLEVRNDLGVAVLVLTSAELWDERFLITVTRGDGATIGTIKRQSRLRKPRYALEADGQRVGTIVADRRWTVRHHVLDAQGREVARVAPLRRGWFARALAREPAGFAVQITLPLPDPLHSLLLAAALTADTALKRHEPDSGTSG